MFVLKFAVTVLVVSSISSLAEGRRFKNNKNKYEVDLPKGIDASVERELRRLTRDEKKYLEEAQEYAKERLDEYNSMVEQAIGNGHIVKPFSPSYMHAGILKTPKSFEEIAEDARFLNDVAKYFHNMHNIDLGTVSIEGTALCDEICRSSGRFKQKGRVFGGFGSFNVWQCNPFDTFRTISGRCNNLVNPSAGQSGTPLARLMENAYNDGFREPRIMSVIEGEELTCAREISERVLSTESAESPELSLMLMQWGQFLDHDLSLSPIFRMDDNMLPIECCDEDGNIITPAPHPECIPICIREDDPFFSTFEQRCMNLVRSVPSTPIHPILAAREQMNALTSFIDASMVYGSTEEESDRLRSFKEGKLRTQEDMNLLPNQTTLECPAMDDLQCFLAGDERVNEAIQLTVMHTVWLREHNRIADYIHKNTYFNDEKVFQLARKIVGAEVQHITYNEFLPILLGSSKMEEKGLSPLPPNEFYNGYNPKLNPTILTEFSTAAYRFGHSLLQTMVNLVDANGDTVGSNRLHEVLMNPFALHEANGVEQLARGIPSQPAQKSDRRFTEEVSQHLFQGASSLFGMDLPALNIQRGRDHGLQPYNKYREWCGLSKFTSFEDMQDELGLSDDVMQSLEAVYADVNDVDLFVGGMLEPHGDDSILGPTFRCIIAEQFFRLKNGDRFFYENNRKYLFYFLRLAAPFKQRQLKEIKTKVNLARIFCENAGMEYIQEDVFRNESPSNPLKKCEDLPTLDLNKFARSIWWWNH